MNKPVAYGYVWTSIKDCMETRFTRSYPLEFYKPIDIVPVYTHPAELTDEEILNEWLLTNYNPKTYVWANDTDDDLVLQFAKAILRKAQEK